METELPTLGDILLNTASPPWTLHAFTAHLNRHCCLEALQFILDTQHYAACYEGLVRINSASSSSSNSVAKLWQNLIKLYILPTGQRQLNIAEKEREHLLHLPPEPPPSPSELHEACRCAYDLLNDSLTAFFRTSEPMQDSEETRSPPDQQPQLQAAATDEHQDGWLCHLFGACLKRCYKHNDERASYS
ncbi:serine/threonine-protein phosphatase 2A 56 kDa regulatory subunit delta isoform [Metarhizium acridum]|uniref:serine/threonine-protein phosphatase 2A 56 kDa regulatory subunit delta isoform n=1 Tax=Metarhizium acridum TaxID=92637 RepID=UPI001C6D0732|nr:serine/threonine-protein phosphatase 2A 56 kDa regulatory subunit delta isoform [Metarhizium acridum]